MIEDFGNGTRDLTYETFRKETANLQINQSELRQLSAINVMTTNDSTSYTTTTLQTSIEQEVIMGFTYEIAKIRQELVNVGGRIFWIIKWWVKAGINVDVEFGLRLPVNITLEYPEQMMAGNNYTYYATLTPIDKPDYNEFLCVFQTYLWVEVGVTGLGKWRQTFGPDYNYSKSFETPLGPDVEIPILPIEIPLWELGINFWIWELPAFLKVNLVIEPAFGSEKITAIASATGDANITENRHLEWSIPNQRLNFTVNADDHDPYTDYAFIQLRDFRYYFTKFSLHIKILFDFHDFVNDYIGPDPELTIATVDMSWLLELLGGPYLGTHQTLSISIYVEKVVPPPILIVSISICPEALNLQARSKWITTYIELPQTNNLSDINTESIRLNHTVPAEPHPIGIEDHNNDGIPELMVKFNRSAVRDLIISHTTIQSKFEQTTLTVTGYFMNGTQFEASNTITVITGIHQGLSGGFPSYRLFRR